MSRKIQSVKPRQLEVLHPCQGREERLNKSGYRKRSSKTVTGTNREKNEACEKEFEEGMAQRDLELKLECRKRELDLLRKKRNNGTVFIVAQN